MCVCMCLSVRLSIMCVFMCICVCQSSNVCVVHNYCTCLYKIIAMFSITGLRDENLRYDVRSPGPED